MHTTSIIRAIIGVKLKSIVFSCLFATEMDFGEDPLENQGKKRSEMAQLERSWRWGRTF
jgi:hypothetical protein